MGFCRRYKLYPIRMFPWGICSTIDCLSLILNLQISNIPQSYLAPPLGFVKNFLNYARPMTIPEGNLTIIHGWIYIAFPRVKSPAVPYILHSFRIRRQIVNPMPEKCSHDQTLLFRKKNWGVLSQNCDLLISPHCVSDTKAQKAMVQRALSRSKSKSQPSVVAQPPIWCGSQSGDSY
jgi:hypothetical protein